ncbi:MAG: cytochrome c [Candidatus Sulfopaludibacter sp.]|nr:cytochrome c [Candidatus Sulfopaludibacter sp.]
MKLLIGILIGLLVVAPLGAYFYVKLGFLSLATTAKPLPMEEFMAHTALRESIGSAQNLQDPLPVTDENLLAGFKAYREHCAVCHGLPGESKPVIAAGMFPPPPQLMVAREMVTDDPEGATFWKVSNGIRLSGMPRFDTLPETTRWQLTMFLKHADRLPPAAQAGLRR